MYLKEIEISGFKSFADKITLNLDNNITCIVGPNGSGKSNIVDAIRFVLGEQSVKSLRGDNLMSDVIFNGSKNRNPMHSASVSLTFDNSDHYLNVPYNNVSVKRRLYKTGENEYFLNGEKSRLKDILDLFLDSSIGRDSFNIIGQGDIAKILSSSPTDRRIVIEEASGILKYKKRREEAFKKLDKTNLNLERVNDIIIEVENRLTPLKEQSEKAREYIKTKDLLQKIEVSYLVASITEKNLKYQEKKAKEKILEEEILHLNTIINDPLIDSLKVKELEYSKRIQELNAKLIESTKEKEELNRRRLILKEREKYDSEDIKVYENIEYLKEKSFHLENDIKLLEKDLEKNETKKKEFEVYLNSEIDSINNLRLKKEKEDKLFNALSKELLESKNKLDILKNNLTSNSYLNPSVRSILENPKLAGIVDALINLVEVSKDYQKAFDVASSSNKNFIIAESDSSIKDAIEYLKNNHLGRATFLPLSIIKGKFVDEETLNMVKNKNGYLGILSDFLTFDERFKNVVLNQYGNILVVDNIENANNLSKKIQSRYRIITLDGEIIHVGGSITGGSIDFKTNSSLKNNIAAMQLEIRKKEQDLEKINTNLLTMDQEISDLDRNILKNRSELIKTIDSLNSVKEKLSKKKKELEESKEELNSLTGDKEEKNIDKEFYDKSFECEMQEKRLKDLLFEKEDLEKEISELEGKNKENRQRFGKLESEKNELKIELSKLDYQLDEGLNQLNQDYNLTYERAKEEYFEELDLEFAKEKIDSYKKTLKSIGMVNLDSIKEFEEVNQRYLYLSSERDDLLHAKEMLYSIIEDMDDVMQSDFLKTFKELEIEFKKVFVSMFKGGEASINLTDPDNILETGVEIIASPPGKKLKTISLLSGGEKTLTAISLLFAILNIRSVPFCVFDEVEAALDEANVDNFGTYLENYKNKTQFLLITHKKRTMEYAKTLYGITMQESGVSKLVSVKLEEN